MGFYLSVIKTLDSEDLQFTIGGLGQLKRALSELAGFFYEDKMKVGGFDGDELFYYLLDADFNTIIHEDECKILLNEMQVYREDFVIDCTDKDHPDWMLRKYDVLVSMLKTAVENDARVLFG